MKVINKREGGGQEQISLAVLWAFTSLFLSAAKQKLKGSNVPNDRAKNRCRDWCSNAVSDLFLEFQLGFGCIYITEMLFKESRQQSNLL